jgi:transposase
MINVPAGARILLATPVEFAALFDGLDWTRVQTIRGIPNPAVAV